MKRFVFSLLIAAVLTAASYALVWLAFPSFFVPFSAWGAVNLVEAGAVFTSYSCTYLCVFQTRWNYPIGVVSTALWSALFFMTGSPALAVFNLYLVFSLAYGWFRWRSDDDTRPVTNTSMLEYLLYTALGVVILALFVGANVLFNPGLGLVAATQLLSPWDVGLAVASGVAQFMLDNKKLENWFLWVGVNVFSIPYFLFVTAPMLPFTAIQFAVFLGNAVWGYVCWKRSTVTETELEEANEAMVSMQKIFR